MTTDLTSTRRVEAIQLTPETLRSKASWTETFRGEPLLSEEAVKALPTPPESPERRINASSASAERAIVDSVRPQSQEISGLFKSSTFDTRTSKQRTPESTLSELENTPDRPDTRGPISQASERRTISQVAFQLTSSAFKVIVKAPVFNLANFNKTSVSKIVTLVRRLNEGEQLEKEYSTWKLPSSGYEEVVRRINDDDELRGYFHDKLEYEYSYTAQRFTIRMNGAFHHDLGLSVATEILDNLNKLQQKSSGLIRERIAAIKSAGSKKMRTIDGHKLPDQSFGYKWQGDQGDMSLRLPLVVEVTWSREPWTIDEKAPIVIGQSQNTVRVRTVVHLDANRLYKSYQSKENDKKGKGKGKAQGDLKLRDQTARFSVQRAIFQDGDNEGEVKIDPLEYQVGFQYNFRLPLLTPEKTFQDRNGQPVEGVSLNLNLRDFLLRRHETELDEVGAQIVDPVVSISSQRLCEFVTSAMVEEASDKMYEEDNRDRRKIRDKTNKDKTHGARKRVDFGKMKDTMKAATRRSSRIRKPVSK
ncbi:MAG: hypothetical protein M1820_008295 [Bogoriella megaspora]|nr:MAG: hypothetical protein M1820_008295 [Bogoriella megaspora]